CVTCPEPICPLCVFTTKCWIQKRFCYSCGSTHCVKSPKRCIFCPQIYPTCGQCPPNYKCQVWNQDCFTCAQARCVPESYDPNDYDSEGYGLEK
ncbi:7386_t:CDS:2, partial [Dentiscutata erythropus]